MLQFSMSIVDSFPSLFFGYGKKRIKKRYVRSTINKYYNIYIICFVPMDLVPNPNRQINAALKAANSLAVDL